MEKFTWKTIDDHLERYPVPPHHVWFFEEKREIAVEKPSEYFLEHGIGVEKVNMYGIPKELQQKIYDEVENSGIAHITDPVGENMQFFRKVLTELEAPETLGKTESDYGTGNEYWRFGFGCGCNQGIGCWGSHG